MATAADVPGRYDCVINGTGYLFYDQIDESLPFRTAKAIYSYSPTFVERQNTQGNFGDNQQDFWLTSSQNDWTQGSGQRFFRGTDPDSRSHFYTSLAADVSLEGEAKLGKATSTTTFGGAVTGAGSVATTLFFGGTTNLFQVNFSGTASDLGAHGAGGLVSTIASDGTYAYLSGSACTSVRSWSGAAFATFSASPANGLAFLDNTLYGTTGGSLYRYDIAGTRSTIQSIQTANGISIGNFQLAALGGKLLMFGRASTSDGPELWVYDGVGLSRLTHLPSSFGGTGMAVSQGIVFMIGQSITAAGTHPTLYYYANGTIGVAWRSARPGTVTGTANIAAYGNGVVFTDHLNSLILYYDLPSSSVTALAAFTPTATNPQMAASDRAWGLAQEATTATYSGSFSNTATTGNIVSSLFDFDSSLDKYVKAVKVDWTAATDGDGGSVDIAYRLNDADGSYTNVQTGAVAGTEYTIGQSCRSISVKVTLNKGTSTLGPVLKRIYVRAAPVLQQFPLRQYTIAAFGDPTEQVQTLRDGTANPKSGRDLANDLITAVSSTTPISITDRFGTYTAVLEPDNFELHEIHANPLTPPAKSGSFVAKVTARGV